jgi:hypothetical protein
MTLNVEVPDPPSLHGPQPRGDYEAIGNPVADPDDDHRREELEGILADGAWADAFEEWASDTGVTPETFDVVLEHDLIQGLDFYWDESSDEVGYQSPDVPEEARETLGGELASDLESALDDLGRVVSETLENDYLLRDDESFGFFADDEAEDAYGERDE